MRKQVFAVALIAIFALSGCATYSNWKPTVDTYGYNDKDMRQLSQDEYECKQLALNASGGAAEETAKGAVVGGLIGAAAGAAIGAAAGSPGTGAAIGAGAGGIGGGTMMGVQADRRYQEAYVSCMRQRGHHVVY